MGKKKNDDAKKAYRKALRQAQIELVKLQRHVIKHEEKVLLIFEGRDGSGKDGTIKRLTEHMSPRETRVVALPKPSDRERTQWYFQRFSAHLPAAGEIVLFNRSWYNRAGVERVMGFCSNTELREFFDNVLPFEMMLEQSGIRLLKYYLDITREEQTERLAARREDPLKQWKLSPIDAKAVQLWDEYSAARDEMLARTSVAASPWYLVQANDKKAARLAVIRHVLTKLDYKGKDFTEAQDDGLIQPFSDAPVHA